jgi:hypothetical protein
MTQEVSERGTVGATFAGILMIIGGILGVLHGIGLVAGGTHYAEPADYWINTSVSTWGWVHLIVGLVVLAAGFGVISGAAWAGWASSSSASKQYGTSSTSHSSPGRRSCSSWSTSGSSTRCSCTGENWSDPHRLG